MDIRLDIDGLTHAIAVAREGSFNAAAQVLGLSQSAVSRSIQSLESAYGMQLFKRAKMGTKVTKDGAAFLKIAEDFVGRARRADNQIRTISAGGTRPLRMGVGPLIAAALLPELLPVLTNDGTHVDLKIASSRQLQLELQQGALDFCICAISRLDYFYGASDVDVHPVSPGSFGLIVRNDHPILAEGVGPQNLAKYRTASGSFIRDSLAAFSFDFHGLQMPSVEIDDYNVLVELALKTEFILIANRLLLISHRHKGITALPVEISAGTHADLVVISSKRDVPSMTRRAIQISTEHLDRAIRDAVLQ